MSQIPVTRKLPVREICARYGICTKTVDRWIAGGLLPAPLVLNKRRYFDLAELERRERERMGRRQPDAEPPQAA